MPILKWPAEAILASLHCADRGMAPLGRLAKSEQRGAIILAAVGGHRHRDPFLYVQDKRA